jgi:hypothetical protein
MVGSLVLTIYAAFSFNAAPIVSLLLALLLALFAFQVTPSEMPYRRSLFYSLSLLGLALCVMAAFTGFSRSHPHFDSAVYGFNADTGKEVWASYDHIPDAWERQFLIPGVHPGTMAEVLPGAQRFALVTTAAAANPLPAPALTVFDDHTVSGVRSLRLRIVSTRQAPVLIVYIGKETPVARASINGRQITPVSTQLSGWRLQYFAVPPEGIELGLELATSNRVEIKASDVSYGLPAASGKLRPRPEDATPMPAFWNDASFVTRSFSL